MTYDICNNTFLGFGITYIRKQKGGKVMYNYGGSFGSNCGCGGYAQPAYAPYYSGYGCGNNSSYAIVLVLFILLVIVIGSRFNR